MDEVLSSINSPIPQSPVGASSLGAIPKIYPSLHHVDGHKAELHCVSLLTAHHKPQMEYLNRVQAALQAFSEPQSSCPPSTTSSQASCLSSTTSSQASFTIPLDDIILPWNFAPAFPHYDPWYINGKMRTAKHSSTLHS